MLDDSTPPGSSVDDDPRFIYRIRPVLEADDFFVVIEICAPSRRSSGLRPATWTVVVYDHSMSAFSARKPEHVRGRALGTAFIVVSATAQMRSAHGRRDQRSVAKTSLAVSARRARALRNAATGQAPDDARSRASMRSPRVGRWARPIAAAPHAAL